MLRKAIFPSRYVQGPNALASFGAEAARIGTKILGLVDESLPEDVLAGLDTNGVDFTLRKVTPECTDAGIHRVVEDAQRQNVDAIAAMGGGKVIDLGRASADALNLPFISVPTIAASDAPTSALAVVYDEAGHVVRDQLVKWNPRLVMVDSKVIAKAPARLFAAGIGDALATYYEAQACFQSGAPNMAAGRQTRLAMAVAQCCLQTILEHGEEALEACRAQTPNEAFEAVLEANILLSGIGFESGGVAAAHAIHHGLAELPETHGFLHGEKVAFGVLVELAMNGASDDEILQLVHFNRALGLPSCLADFGIQDKAQAITIVTKRATRKGEIIYNEPFVVNEADVQSAMMRADKLGQLGQLGRN